MDIIHGLLLITPIHLLAAASPGPDFLLVSQHTLTHGRKSGVLCSLGVSAGLLVHLAYSILGLAVLIASSSTLFWLIKIVGGAYLIYLGWKGLKTKPKHQNSVTQLNTVRPQWYKSVGLGFLCNVLNPKAPIYFVALFTVVLSPTMPMSELMVYGAWIMVLQVLWFSGLALLLSMPRVKSWFQTFGHWLDRVLGGLMIALGFKVLASRFG